MSNTFRWAAMSSSAEAGWICRFRESISSIYHPPPAARTSAFCDPFATGLPLAVQLHVRAERGNHVRLIGGQRQGLLADLQRFVELPQLGMCSRQRIQ